MIMQVKILAHTQLSEDARTALVDTEASRASDGQVVGLSAIRTCYSEHLPSMIAKLEAEKYFGRKATDGEGGTDADRLIRHIMNSGHTSTMEHYYVTFAVEGVSRTLLAQLTRHRHFGYSVQSQRYVKLDSDSRSGGASFVVPQSIQEDAVAQEAFNDAVRYAQTFYDILREQGIPPEDARAVLPNATATNLVWSGNLRAFLEFYSKRGKMTHAQGEIQELAEHMKKQIVGIEPWTASFFRRSVETKK